MTVAQKFRPFQSTVFAVSQPAVTPGYYSFYAEGWP